MRMQSMYDMSPLWIQHLMVTGYGHQAKRRRYGPYYREHLAFLDKFDHFSREQQRSYQLQELLKLLRYVRERSPFYRDLYTDVDIDSLRDVTDLRRLPVVTKDMLRENIEQIVTISKRSAHVGHTGGTTGMSLTVYNTTENGQQRMATLDHFKAKHGFINMRMKRATFSGKHIVPPGNRNPVFWRYNAAIRQMLYSTFHITDATCQCYIASLNRFRPEAIDGFVSSISEIADYILRHGIHLDFRPRVVFPTSETVTPRHRDLIERAFGCKVRDQYASSEGAPFVWECERGSLHYDLSTGVIENMDGSDEVLVTSFTTYGTPLIRYRIGDCMTFTPDHEICPCGYASPLVRSIEGRVVDCLYATNGARVNMGNMANIVKNAPNSIIRAQFVQLEKQAITAKIVVDHNRYRTADGAQLASEMRHKFGADMRITVSVVDSIPRDASGKHSLIINEIARHGSRQVEKSIC